MLAANDLFVGDTGFDGVKTPTAWKQFGFDIDGKVSTETSLDLCQPAAGGKKTSVYPDGDLGIDNGFGKNVMVKILAALVPDLSATITQTIHDGDYTLLLTFDGLGAETDVPALATRLHAGAPLGKPALFDGSDCWSVVPELLDDPTDIESSKVIFPTSALEANVWSSNGVATLTLDLPMGDFPLRLQIHEARMRTTLDPDHQGATLGHIGGVLDTEELIAEFTKTAGTFDPALCQGQTIEAIANQIRQASDILLDGTQDPLQTCNGISIGIGFKMRNAGLAGVGQPTPPVDDPCVP